MDTALMNSTDNDGLRVRIELVISETRGRLAISYLIVVSDWSVEVKLL